MDRGRRPTEAQPLIRPAERPNSTLPRLALKPEKAARALDISVDSYERYVEPEIRLVRRGRLKLAPVRELERWLDENAEAPLAEEIE
jgi:hypothetical protein